MEPPGRVRDQRGWIQARGLAILGGGAAYRRFVAEGLAEGHRDEDYEVQDQRFLGDHETREKRGPPVRVASRPTRRQPPDTVLTAVAGHLRVAPAVLQGPDRGWRIARRRTRTAYALGRRAGFPVTDVAAAWGRDVTTGSASRSRLTAAREKNRGLAREGQRLEKIV